MTPKQQETIVLLKEALNLKIDGVLTGNLEKVSAADKALAMGFDLLGKLETIAPKAEEAGLKDFSHTLTEEECVKLQREWENATNPAEWYKANKARIQRMPKGKKQDELYNEIGALIGWKSNY